MDDVAEGACGKGTFGAGECGLAGVVVVVGIAVGQLAGTGCGVTGSGIEGERKALQVGMGWGCGGGQVEFKGLGWGCRDWRALWKMCCREVGLGGGPGGVEKAVEAGMDTRRWR